MNSQESGCPSRELNTGQSIPIHELDLSKSPEIRISVIEVITTGYAALVSNRLIY